ncbi:MAG: TrmH family RNA methyltransferase [Chloroflexota bacterium]|nr:TrmH family RNA methyltransferase [Chloroflexota bacterium]
MNIRLKRYKKDFEHTYAFGVFPTLELLLHQPQHVIGVVTHPDGNENAGITQIRAICHKNGILCEQQLNVFSRLKARGNDYAIGVYRKNYPALDPVTNHVLLVNPSGMGNLGTIIRTMLGFGCRDLAIIKPAADHFNPKVVRASMGAVFQMRIAAFQDFDTYGHAYPRNFYPLMTDGDTKLHGASFYSPYTLIFGNESSGLDDVYRQQWTSVSIPQSGAVDSLNIAISVGIVLYQASLARKQ